MSESLWECLHWLEVSLRNNIHTAASRAWGASWLTNGQLLSNEQKMVDEVISRLVDEGKDTTPVDLVAALPFGFWTSLFRKEYENKLRALLMNMFPYVTPTHLRTRSNIADRLNTIRKFRNRVFHFEPILNYKPDVRYGEIRQLIEWMAPEVVPLLLVNCKFNIELSKTDKHYLPAVRTLIGEME